MDEVAGTVPEVSANGKVPAGNASFFGRFASHRQLGRHHFVPDGRNSVLGLGRNDAVALRIYGVSPGIVANLPERLVDDPRQPILLHAGQARMPLHVHERNASTPSCDALALAAELERR